MANEPMNAFAEEDFRNAIDAATRETQKSLDDIAESFRNWKPTAFMVADDRKNKAVLTWECGAWQDFIGILLSNGYEVTAKADGIEVEVTWGDKE